MRQKLDIWYSIWYNSICEGERGKRNSLVTMKLQKTPIGLKYHITCWTKIPHIMLDRKKLFDIWCLIWYNSICEGERGIENPNQQTSPVSNVSARVSDNLSPTKQEKDQKGWCREHIWSILWWGFDSFSREPFYSLLCNYLLRKDYRWYIWFKWPIDNRDRRHSHYPR